MARKKTSERSETYYVWSPIAYATGDAGNLLTLGLGEEATASKLKLDDDQFQQLIDGGSIRTIPFPDMPENYAGSPQEWWAAQLRAVEGDVAAALELGVGPGVPSAPPAALPEGVVAETPEETTERLQREAAAATLGEQKE